MSRSSNASGYLYVATHLQLKDPGDGAGRQPALGEEEGRGVGDGWGWGWMQRSGRRWIGSKRPIGVDM
jgi:hypothetical protein